MEPGWVEIRPRNLVTVQVRTWFSAHTERKRGREGGREGEGRDGGGGGRVTAILGETTDDTVTVHACFWTPIVCIVVLTTRQSLPYMPDSFQSPWRNVHKSNLGNIVNVQGEEERKKGRKEGGGWRWRERRTGREEAGRKMLEKREKVIIRGRDAFTMVPLSVEVTSEKTMCLACQYLDAN